VEQERGNMEERPAIDPGREHARERLRVEQVEVEVMTHVHHEGQVEKIQSTVVSTLRICRSA